jgi:ribosomal protein S27AE
MESITASAERFYGPTRGGEIIEPSPVDKSNPLCPRCGGFVVGIDADSGITCASGEYDYITFQCTSITCLHVFERRWYE